MSTGQLTPPAQRTLRCRTVAAGGLRQLNYVRDLPPLAVEERFGPPDTAPTATAPETMLAALGSCLSARIHANAAAGSILVHSLELEVEADVAVGSIWEPRVAQPGPTGFKAIRVAVHLYADASPEALDALIAHAVLWSPVASTLHDPVHLDVTMARSPAPESSTAAPGTPSRSSPPPPPR